MKNILLLAPQDNDRVRYLMSVIEGRYNVCRYQSADAAVDKLEELSHDISVVIVDDPSSQIQSDILIDHIRRNNSYMLAVPVLALTDHDNKNANALLLSDTVVGIIEQGEDARVVCHRMEKSIQVINSASFAEFSNMLKALPSLIYLKDVKGRYIFCSQYWHHLEGIDDPDWTIRGKTDMDIRKDKDNARKAYESDLKIVATGKGTSYVIKEVGEDFTDYLQLIKEPVFDDDGRVKGIIAIINNVTEQELLKQELRRKSITDELTGLYNRTYYDEYLESISDDDYPLSIISADCDGLKHINDVYGHLVGDEYIRMAATMMKNVLPENAAIFRTGGDEFLAVIPHADEEAAGDFLTQLGEHERIFSIRDNQLSVSFGSCTVHVPSGALKEFIALSDAEMYRNKRDKKENRQEGK